LKLTWISSEGGPLLVAPQSAVSSWAGVPDLDGPAQARDDYGRACSVDGYIGLVDVGERQALVLGDEPAMTTYLAGERLFLRWVAAQEEDDLIHAARRALHGVPDGDQTEEVLWEVDGPVVLFDSGRAGTELEPDTCLVVDLEPATYRVRAVYREDGENWMILVHLHPVPPD